MSARRPLNILLSSTRQWNPGDEFICEGVKNLLALPVGRPVNWRLWNRNPDLSVDGFRDTRYREGLLSNSFSGHDFSSIDAIVLAGTPEWYGPRIEPLFEAALAHTSMPFLMVGIGSNFQITSLSPHCLSALQRPNTWISTRNADLTRDLNALCGATKVRTLPCPALFCANAVRTKVQAQDRFTIILQVPGTGLHAIAADYYEALRAAITNAGLHEVCDIVAFYEGEVPRLQSDFPDYAIHYCADARDYYFLLGSYRGVISTRLHGAIGTLSLGVPAFLLDRGDFRLNTTAREFAALLPLGEVGDAIAWARAVLAGKDHLWQRRLRRFQSATRLAYAKHFGHALYRNDNLA